METFSEGVSLPSVGDVSMFCKSCVLDRRGFDSPRHFPGIGAELPLGVVMVPTGFPCLTASPLDVVASALLDEVYDGLLEVILQVRPDLDYMG